MPALISPADERLLAQVAELGARGAAGVAGLLVLFQERSWVVRRAVVATLAAGDATALAAVVDALVTERAHEPTVAGMVDALAAASAAVEPLVAILLERSEAALLCDAVQVAGRRRDRSSVPRLIELASHPDDNVALAAVEALGRIGGGDAIDRLIELAEGDHFFRAFPAIEVLGAAREPRAVPALQRLLQKPLYASEAARALGRIGDFSAVGPLFRSLEAAPDTLVRVLAESLGAIQDASDQSLGPKGALSHLAREYSTPALRSKVARALAGSQGVDTVAVGRLLIWLAEEESVSDFISLLGVSDEMTKLGIEGLRKLSAVADARVLSALTDGSSDLRSQLLPVLTGIAAANQAIAACLDDPQPAVRALACHALARSHATSAVPRLFELLTDADLGVVHAAVGAIQSLGSAETERLARAAAVSANADERRAALRIVMYFGFSGSLELAQLALASDDERLRDIALAGLPALDEPQVPAILLEMSQHVVARTRASAIRALGHLPPNDAAADAVRAALGDSDAWVRYYACQSLGRLQLAAAVPALVERLSDTAEQVKMAAVEALAAVADPAARQALAAAARSNNREVQRAAIVGIGACKDPALRGELLSAIESSDAGVRLVSLASLAIFPGAEGVLELAVSEDASASVRSSALELLANMGNADATLALARLLGRGPVKEVLTALVQNVDARIPSLLGLLGDADEALARNLVAVLARAETRAARAALDIAFESANVGARRATAKVLGQILDFNAKASLARAATQDVDREVRRICIAAIA